MRLKKKLNALVFGATVGLMSLPCLADITGTVTLPGGETPDLVTVRVYEHFSPTSSGLTGSYTFEGGTFTLPTKKDKAYRFEMRAEKSGVEYYGLEAQIPYDATTTFALEKMYPMELSVQDQAGNLLEAYIRYSWDKGYREFANWAYDGSHTIFDTQFRPGNHTFKVEAKGYEPQSINVKVAQYRTPMTVALKPVQQGYTLTGRIRYEDGTPVATNHYFEQGNQLRADTYQGKFYFAPVHSGTELVTILPKWNEAGAFTIPNLLPGDYATEVIFEQEGKAYHIFEEVKISENGTHDFVARPTNVLKVSVKDPEGNLIDQVGIQTEQLQILESGTHSNKSINSTLRGSRNAIFPGLAIGACTVTLDYPGYKPVKQTIDIQEGMNRLEITLEK